MSDAYVNTCELLGQHQVCDHKIDEIADLTARLASLHTRLAEAEQRGRALLAVAKAVHPIFSKTANEYGACGICGRIKHPAFCDCPIGVLDTEYPGWRTEWRHGRPHDARMAEDHDEA